MSGSAGAGFSGRAVAWAAGIAVVSFLLAFVLAAFGDDLQGARGHRPTTFSRSALGHRALAEVLEDSGFAVGVHRTEAPPELDSLSALVFAEPVIGFLHEGAAASKASFLASVAAESDSPVLLVLPKWIGVPKLNGTEVARVHRMATVVIDPALEKFLDELPREPVDGDEPAGDAECPPPRLYTAESSPALCELGATSYRLEVDEPRFLTSREDLVPVVTCGEHTLVARHAATTGRTYVLSDPDVLNNQGLARADHAALVLHLLANDLKVSSVLFDETSHGLSRSNGLLAELLRFPLVLAVLHGLLLLGLVVWAGFRRLGKPLTSAPAGRDGKRVLIENAAQLLTVGHHTGESLRRYFEQTLRAVGAHFFYPPDLPLPALRTRLQTVSRARGLEIDLERTGQRVEQTSRSRSLAAEERAVRIARRLHRWRQEMTDGNR